MGLFWQGHGDLNSAPTHLDNGHQSRENLVPAVRVPVCVPGDLCARQFSVNQIIIFWNSLGSQKLFFCGESFKCWVHLEFFVSCIVSETWIILVTDKKLLVLSFTLDFLSIIYSRLYVIFAYYHIMQSSGYHWKLIEVTWTVCLEHCVNLILWHFMKQRHCALMHVS